MLLAALALCLGALLVAATIDPRPRCAACRTRTEAEDAEGEGPAPTVVMITYRCPRCRRVACRRPLVLWD